MVGMIKWEISYICAMHFNILQILIILQKI
jgi:hypothetical protein